MLAQDIEPEGA